MIQQFPGALNPLSARLIEEKGFAGVYICGAVLASDLGLPGLGAHRRPVQPKRCGHLNGKNVVGQESGLQLRR